MRFLTLLTVIAATALSAGCGDDPTGSVVIRYQLGNPNQTTCQDERVVEIQARMTSPERGELLYTDRCQSGADRTFLISGVPVDAYTVVVEGINFEGAVVWTSQAVPLSVVEGGTSETPLMRLEPMPAQLEVWWRFDNGRTCSRNNVQDIEVGYYFSDTYRSEIFPCDSPYPAVLTLDFNGVYDIRVRAIDVLTDEYTFWADADDIQAQEGQVTVLDDDVIVLMPCETDCTP